MAVKIQDVNVTADAIEATFVFDDGESQQFGTGGWSPDLLSDKASLTRFLLNEASNAERARKAVIVREQQRTAAAASLQTAMEGQVIDLPDVPGSLTVASPSDGDSVQAGDKLSIEGQTDESATRLTVNDTSETNRLRRDGGFTVPYTVPNVGTEQAKIVIKIIAANAVDLGVTREVRLLNADFVDSA